MAFSGLKSVVSLLVEEGIFGDVKYADLQLEEAEDIGAQFSSTLVFASLMVEGSYGKQAFPLVAKLPYSDPETRDARNCDTKFHNEVTMYKEILPDLSTRTHFYPKMYYATTTGALDRNMLILENVKCRNFVMSRDKIFLDFDHVSLAIRTLGKFHALSYILKHKDRNRFFKIAKKLKEVELPKSVQERLQVVQFATMERGIKPLLDKNHTVVLKKLLDLLKSPYHIKKMISFPEEPYAVICHGDFCNNNVAYKYNEVGKPTHSVFFDFQLSRYSSPAIDLFFFLYMHTTSAFREKYWDEILEIYWNSLKNSLPDDLEIPCFEDYLKHFSGRVIYGFVICSWFLPSLMDHNPVTKDDYMALSLEEKVARFLALAGKKGEQVVTDVVSHMLKKKYILDFVELWEEKKKNWNLDEHVDG